MKDSKRKKYTVVIIRPNPLHGTYYVKMIHVKAEGPDDADTLAQRVGWTVIAVFKGFLIAS